MKNNKIYVGSLTEPTFYFENNEITSIDGALSVDLIGMELNADEITLNVVSEAENFESSIPYGTPVWYYNNDNLIGKFYSKRVKRIGIKEYELVVQSVIGVLEHETFYGGYFNGEKVSSVFNRVICQEGVANYAELEYAALEGDEILGGSSHDGTGRITYEFFYEGISGAGLSGLSDVVFLFGYDFHSGSDVRSLYFSASVTRQSESSQWNETLTFYLHIMGQTIQTATISPNTMISVDVIPTQGKIIVNGQTYSFQRITTATLEIAFYFNGMNAVFTQYYGGLKGKFYSASVQASGVDSTKQGTIYNISPAERFFDGTKIVGILSRYVLSNTPRATFYTPVLGSPSSGAYKQSSTPYTFTLTNVHKEILETTEYDEGISDIQVYGWIPVCSRRDALHKLLFSQGITLAKGADGAILLSYLKNSTPTSISEDDITENGDIQKLNETYKIEITEHSFQPVDTAEEEPTILFDNSSGTSLSNALIVYDASAPVDTSHLTTEGITISLAGTNAAIVSGLGIIKGYQYSHGQNVISRYISDNPDGSTVSITDNTLITLENSEQVADRLKSYYESAVETSVEMKLSGQRCGNRYSLFNFVREAFTGFLTKIDVVVSSILLSSCQFISGYTPVNPGGNYSNGILLTGNGTWTVPSEVFEKDTPRIRVVLVSGGTGGFSGLAGEDGDTPYVGGGAPIKEAGAGGLPGAGGRVNVVTINNPSRSYSYGCGTGGDGGSICYSHEESNAGRDGTDTTFGSYTTQGYSPSANGVRNFFTGDLYGYSTNDDIGGKPGVPGTGWGLEGETRIPLVDMDNLVVAGFDEDGSIKVNSIGMWGQDYIASGTVKAAGGCGSGAAVGMNGVNGENATSSRTGNGGKGADATATPPKPTLLDPGRFGYGGYGGYGGAPGGSAGITLRTDVSIGTPGSGGYGGKGGTGADGCIIVYY